MFVFRSRIVYGLIGDQFAKLPDPTTINEIEKLYNYLIYKIESLAFVPKFLIHLPK